MCYKPQNPLMNITVISQTLIPWVGRTAKAQRHFIADRLKANGCDLTFEQWLLLVKLNHQDGQSQNNLAYVTNRNKASLARLITALEKKNLVKRVPSKKDKRANQIFLTPNGQLFFDKTIPIVYQAFEIMQKDISPKEQELAIRILKKIQNNISNFSQ